MNHPHYAKYAATLIFSAILQGCVTTYVARPDEPMVTVHTVGFGQPQMCKDGKYYWAPRHKSVENAISIPAGERITLGAHLTSDGYQIVHYCRPFLSFQPKVGQTYFMNSAMSGDGRCGVELVREDSTSATGLTVEHSVAPPSCHGPK
jgi:hypothetical protein